VTGRCRAMTNFYSSHTRLVKIFVCFSVLSSACSHTGAPDGFPGLAIRANCIKGQVEWSSDVDERYPGERAFWVKSQLRGTDAFAPLPCIEPPSESYQLRWSSTLAPTDSIIRISRAENKMSASIFYQMRDTLNIVSSEHAQLSKSDWDRLRGSISSLSFWTTPSKLSPKPGTSATLDGGGVIIEGYYDGRYHLVCRDESDPKLADLHEAFFAVVRTQQRLPQSH
jgi:hypothetical protein